MPDFLQKKVERTLAAGMTIDEMGIVSHALHKSQINLRFQDHAISKTFIEVNLLKLKIKKTNLSQFFNQQIASIYILKLSL
jgi:hypothetical protein